jgi:MFS family permease
MQKPIPEPGAPAAGQETVSPAEEPAHGLPAGEPPPAPWRLTFRALRHRNYRIFLSGQAVSLIGTWMQNLAQSWLVYRLTGSELLVSLVGFFSYLPVLLIGPLAGAVADRFSRYRIVLATQTVFTVQALALAALTLSGRITAGHVFALAAVWGVINAFDVPARQALFIHMVGREDLLNAIALNSVIFNTARVAGPAVAGLLIAAVGEGTCFLLNAVTFLAVIASLLALRLPPQAPVRPDSPWAHLRGGLRYAARHRPVRTLLATNALTNIARAPAVALAPFFADAIFHRGARGLGLLTGAAGLGAVAGTLNLARQTAAAGLPGVVLSSVLVTGACLVLFAFSPWFGFALAAYALVGYSQMRQNAATNTLVQTLIPDEYRGRIMALFSMTVIGVMPAGQLAGGALAEKAGTRWTVFLGGLVCLGGAIAYQRSLEAIRRAVRQREARCEP